MTIAGKVIRGLFKAVKELFTIKVTINVEDAEKVFKIVPKDEKESEKSS